MNKILIGPKLRQIRLEKKQTQAQMAATLGLSASYINLLENNQRSLSVPVLMSISTLYGVDWRDLTSDESAHRLADLRHVVQDPIFGETKPDLQELRAALDHAPALTEKFLQLYKGHRVALEKIMRVSDKGGAADLLQSSPEAVVHDFFRTNANHFPALERAAERAAPRDAAELDDLYPALRDRLATRHKITVKVRPIEEMEDAFRIHDVDEGVLRLSQALDRPNRTFQLAHMLCLVEFGDVLDGLIASSGIDAPQATARLRVELANYFAAAYLMPYGPFLRAIEDSLYDIDRVATAFSTSFEQVCQRLTTLQRDGAKGVPFFFLRIDKAGNVTKRFNATSFNLAEFGGACPVWNIHNASYTPGVILPQFVEMPDGDRFFTFSRTVHRPVFSWDTQDRRLTLALGCELKYAQRIGYASKFNLDDATLFAPIGINCHLCPRAACSQRAHQSLFVELPLDTNRRGSTRYES